MTLEAGQDVLHFRILEKIGEGGMGEVWRARDTRLDREVAIKVMSAETLGDEERRSRFRREALSLSKLNHPNIAIVHDFVTEGELDLLVMEYVRGVGLDERLESGPLSEEEVLRLGAELADGLASAHGQGIVHRDLAGNVREWCLNETSRAGERLIQGGGWNDRPYAFNDAYAQAALDRSETNGFRCIRSAGSAVSSERLARTIELPFRDFFAEEPVDEKTYRLYLDQYAYDRTELNAEVEESSEEEDWIVERVSFDATYGGELTTDQPSETNRYRDYVRMWAHDLSRTIDYLETRDDIDHERLAYWGVSWGGRMAPIMLAVEPRFKTAVLHVAGLKFQRALPEADPFNFVTRVKLPVLMINGRNDFFFPLETSQRPMFELLGTPEADKKWVVYDGGHSVPRAQRIKESLAWLDRYLGPGRFATDETVD